MTDGVVTPPAADPGDISPPIAPYVAPAASPKTFAQQRQAQDQAAADAAKPPATDKQQPTPAGDKHKFGEMEFTEQELRDLLTAKGEAELRKANLPASPADYAADLPADFEMPAGVEFKIDANDPLLTSARDWAHAKGFDQQTFSEMVGLYASVKATEQAQLNVAHADQVAKMGFNGPMRVTALETWLRGIVGDKLAGPMRSMMATADIVKGLELIQHRMVSQGSASFSQTGRVAPEANPIPNYEGMTFAQRRQAQDELARR